MAKQLYGTPPIFINHLSLLLLITVISHYLILSPHASLYNCEKYPITRWLNGSFSYTVSGGYSITFGCSCLAPARCCKAADWVHTSTILRTPAWQGNELRLQDLQVIMAMAISHNWLFLWDFTFYKWGFLFVLITDITRALTVSITINHS